MGLQGNDPLHGSLTLLRPSFSLFCTLTPTLTGTGPALYVIRGSAVGEITHDT